MASLLDTVCGHLLIRTQLTSPICTEYRTRWNCHSLIGVVFFWGDFSYIVFRNTLSASIFTFSYIPAAVKITFIETLPRWDPRVSDGMESLLFGFWVRTWTDFRFRFFRWLIKRTAQQISWLYYMYVVPTLSSWPLASLSHLTWLTLALQLVSVFSAFCQLLLTLTEFRFHFRLYFFFCFDEGHDACNVLVTTVRRCILAQSFINLVAGQIEWDCAAAAQPRRSSREINQQLEFQSQDQQKTTDSRRPTPLRARVRVFSFQFLVFSPDLSVVSSRYILLRLRLFRSSIARTFETLFLLILALFLSSFAGSSDPSISQ